MEFENSVHGGDVIAEGQQMATSMLVLLVKGIFTKLSFPYVQFPCTALSGDQLYDPLGKLSVVWSYVTLRCWD